MSQGFKTPTFAGVVFNTIVFSNIIFGEEGGDVPVIWILTTGFWNDSAPWVDTETWND